MRCRRFFAGVVAGALACALPSLAGAQTTPRPFPRPEQPRQPAPPKPAPPGTAQPPTPAAPAPSATAEPPTEAMLGVPIYPNARFLASYDAGRGQRYYLFGTAAGFNDLVAYYRTVTKDRGELVFDAPATHMFEMGRYREETMAFPPGVTIKDYTWGGSGGYLNPVPGAQPARFPTIIQIVPVAPEERRR